MTGLGLQASANFPVSCRSKIAAGVVVHGTGLIVPSPGIPSGAI